MRVICIELLKEHFANPRDGKKIAWLFNPFDLGLPLGAIFLPLGAFFQLTFRIESLVPHGVPAGIFAEINVVLVKRRLF